MSGKQYLKNRLPVIFLNLSGILALSVFLFSTASANSHSVRDNAALSNASGNTNLQSILFISAAWLLVLILYLTAAYFYHKRRLNRLMAMTRQLNERYLIAELMAEPENAQEQVYYRILKISEKSMLEKIEASGREQKEYREYIEQWIHEVKTPITAMKLLCENNRSDFSRELLTELEKISHFTEQALYYARSEHTERDYSIREVWINNIVHEAISDNKYLLLQNHIKIEMENLDNTVYTDDKWVRFLLGQVISNAVKYRAEQPAIYFSSAKQANQVLLSVEDNGIGIPDSDLPRIFEKGFTGQNGRIIHSSTGIGLYLCKRLCNKLGIGLTIRSAEHRTIVTFIFSINDFITGVQS